MKNYFIENTLGFSYVGSVRPMEFPFVGGWEHGILKKMGVNVHRSTVYNSQDMETT